MWQREIGTFQVNFGSQGNEWAHHVAVELAGDKHLGITGTDGICPVEIEPPRDGPLTSKLQVSPHEDGISCVVVGDYDCAPDGQVEPWRRAAEAAVAALGKRDCDFEWQAVIDADECMLHGLAAAAGVAGVLRTTWRIGPIYLSPGGICLRTNLAPTDQFSSTRGGFRYTFPVIASGHVRSYDWDQAILVVRYGLRRICTILTICTGVLWVPRSEPMEVHAGQQPLRLSAELGPPVPHVEWDGTIPPEMPSLKLPGWADSSWVVLDAEEVVTTAADAYYEARLLDGDHPSVAFALYIAAIEGIGAREREETTCACCENCTAKTSALTSFRKGLKTIMTNSQLKQFDADLAYDLRSHTDHTGRLFSSEVVFGHPIISYFTQSNDIAFTYGRLWPTRAVARRVLIKALGGSPPPWGMARKAKLA